MCSCILFALLRLFVVLGSAICNHFLVKYCDQKGSTRHAPALPLVSQSCINKRHPVLLLVMAPRVSNELSFSPLLDLLQLVVASLRTFHAPSSKSRAHLQVGESLPTCTRNAENLIDASPSWNYNRKMLLESCEDKLQPVNHTRLALYPARQHS